MRERLQTLNIVPVRVSAIVIIYFEPFIGDNILSTHKISLQIDYY